MSNNVINRELAARLLSTSYDDFSKLCHPLIKKTPISYFDYFRYYDDGHAIGFNILPDLSLNILCESLLPTLEEFKLFSQFGQKACFLSTTMSLPPGVNKFTQEKYEKNLAYAVDHHIYHRLYIIERKENYYSTSGFGVKKDNKLIMNFYLNALPYMQKFIRYFESHAKESIETQYQQNKLFLPHHHDKLVFSEEDPFSDLCSNDLMPPMILQCGILNNLSCMSAREKECLELISKGYTMKNAARKLQISHRTIEQHLRNIKDKYGVSTKNQLVEIWHANEV